MENLKYFGMYFVLVTVVTTILWVGGTFFAKSVKSYEVISPTKGVECIIVSRMFNTSVDCWK